VTAYEIIAEITTSPAWQSHLSDLHRIQLNLDEEAFQITESCINLTKLADLITSATPSDTPTSIVRADLTAAVSEYEAYYEQAKASVVNRVAALSEYRTALRSIEALLDDIAKISLLEGHTTTSPQRSLPSCGTTRRPRTDVA
jgi:hypothetical protein